MNVEPFIVATAGHVDHGKSALVRALTGTDPDRLPEEKARGITIDLGFAHLDLPTPTRTLCLGIVDVPGHEDFVTNMVAGVGSIDLALLVVAADDGWMPQTEEHLQILTYLGVKRAVVALTKVDLAQSEAEAGAQVREKLRGSPFAEAPIVGTSVISGARLGELKLTLARALEDASPQPDIGKPRLATDRAFILKGVGTVVTGTLTGGSLRKGQPIIVQPSGRTAKVRTVQSFNVEVETARPGSRVALNLPDLHAGQAHGDDSIHRGDVITLPELGRPSDTIDVSLEVSPRARGQRPLKEATLVRFHHGSGNAAARLYLLGTKQLSPGERAVGQLRFESPVYAFTGDRFILRDWPEQHTLAGGIVLDPDAPRRDFRDPARQAALESSAASPDAPDAFIMARLFQEGAVSRDSILVKSRFAASAVDQAVARLAAAGKAILIGQTLADRLWWSDRRTRALEAIAAAHRDHPEEPGLRLPDLRHDLGNGRDIGDVFDALVADLCARECARTGTAIRLTSHRPALPPKLQAAGTRLRASLAAGKLDPPSRSQLAPDPLAQQALRFLIQSGEAVDVGDELVLSSEAYEAAVGTVRQILRQRNAATVSEIRQAMNSSRRVMVPLLEKLDREGITVRRGDQRILKQPL